jgi:hypothetical protein
MSEGGREAVQADDEVVPVAELRRLEERMRDLERLLGRKTLENKGCARRKHPVRAAARYSSSRYRRMMLGSALWMRTSSVRFSIPKSVKARVCSSPMP